MADVASATQEVRQVEQILAQCKVKESQCLKTLHDTRVMLAQELSFEADLYVGFTQGLLERRAAAKGFILEALRSQSPNLSSRSHIGISAQLSSSATML